MKRIFLLLFSVGLLSGPINAQEAAQAPAEATEAQVKPPIVELDQEYQIFPAERLGNSLYRNEERVFSRQGLAIRGILEIEQGLLVHGTNETSERKLELIPNEEVDVKLEELEGGLFHLKVKGGRSKLYRVLDNGQIQDLLPRSNTAGNYVFNGKDKGAFTHIVGGKQIEKDGRTLYQYSFRLHVVEQGTEDVNHLNRVVVDYSPNLNLRWIRENQLQYTDGNGQVGRVTVR